MSKTIEEINDKIKEYLLAKQKQRLRKKQKEAKEEDKEDDERSDKTDEDLEVRRGVAFLTLCRMLLALIMKSRRPRRFRRVSRLFLRALTKKWKMCLKKRLRRTSLLA